ncbi:hypothetical protein [Methylobacter sp.]|uniref:hypothetical protein n=1 Tax=Methylobacter sp. TaxID=2051955 RepID=UPI00120DED22|nr:hypothetical protein [Methylobacter sp.]TAK60200.1 MAG: hypothetical protein EPO18_18035 [Methylobacter sp.]
MNFSLNRDPSVEVPASGSRRVSVWLWLGLFGAPAAWVAQLLLSEPFAAYACYPHQVPLSAPIFEGLPVILMAISIACFAVALLSGFAAWISWRQFEKGRAVKAGEDRNRFLVKLSLLSSFIFIIAVIFNICAVLLVPPCSSWF